MRVLVTGGAGFVGSHVCDALFDLGHEVVIFDNFSTGNMENIRVEGKHHHTFCVGAVQNSLAVEDVFRRFGPQIVIHLAAQAAISTSLEDPAEDLYTNGIGTINVLEAALKCDVKRFVFASTSAVYKYKYPQEPDGFHDPITCERDAIRPDTPYGISKLAAEGYVRTLFPDSAILRFGNIIGERQVPIGENQVLSRMIRHFKYGDKFYVHGSGKQKRDFIHVSDVVSAVVAALDGEPGTYNIASGEAHSVNEIAQIVETYYKVPGYKWDHTEQEDPRAHVCLDITSAKQGLGWEPKVKLFQAVVQTIDWWESQK